MTERGFKQTDEWGKEVNLRPGWESQQHGWKFSKEFEILKTKQNTQILEMKSSINQTKTLWKSSSVNYIKQKNIRSQEVPHTCKPSYSGNRDQ
jgi:hypothetical protein